MHFMHTIFFDLSGGLKINAIMGEIRCSYIRPKIPRDPKVESCWSRFSNKLFTTEFTAALESVNCIHCKSVRLCWYQSSLSGKQDGECSICYNWLSVGIVMESKLEDMVTGVGFENVQLCGVSTATTVPCKLRR